MTDASSEPSSAEIADLFAGGGETGRRMRLHDWNATPLGPPEGWPGALRTAIRIMLTSRYAMWMAWGAELTFFCNDAYLPTVGIKRDWVIGARSDKVWEEIWPDIGPRIARVLTTGEATWDEALLLFLERSGFPEETYHTFSYSPLADDSGRIAGMLCVVTEETERVVGERRLRALGELGARAKEARTAQEACERAAATLSAAPADVPFALVYLADAAANRALLVARAGIAEDHPDAVATLPLDANAPWPLARAMREGAAVPVRMRDAARLPGNPWGDAAAQAVVLPLAAPGQDAAAAGFLVCGVNPRRPLDERYRSFFELAAGHVATAITNARAYEDERRRAETLAELDRAKTTFFSNISHEFRTPLTLMLGPLEELLASSLTSTQRENAGAAHRNGLRLLRMVNTLLDFARVEAGRAQARFARTDLAMLTADLASAFRAACERAGLKLEVDCPPLPAPVPVDPEMWEKIVLNLLSNAFKFTFEGSITVSLRAVDGRAELAVRDTGTGIPAAELPRLFDRFHRVEGAAGRTHEGTGIGLALVQDLVRLHGGTVAVESELGHGTTFTVAVPLGMADLPAAELRDTTALPSVPSAVHTDAFVQEALRWLPGSADPPAPGTGGMDAVGSVGDGARILVADDNADMRDYLRRLLVSAGYRVEAAVDGEAALAAARADPPDLVLSDVMMPRLDGFGLLRQLRDDPRTREAPIILLSARAGEEAEVEGLDAGADDYLVKPFAARELMARVGANLRLARIRREAAETQARWRDLLDRMQEGFCICELVRDEAGRGIDFVFREVSGGYEAMAGVPGTSVLGRRCMALFPELDPFWIETYTRVVDTGEPAHFEEYAAPSGRWFQVAAYRVAPERFGVLFLDVTARRMAAERQALLAREVDHRAKNALAVVQSVVRLTRADSAREYAKAVEGRVAALARAHTLLAEDRWRGADVRAVVEEEIAAYRGAGRVTAAGPAVRVTTEAVQPLSMVLHELATNAAKYGALSVPTGRVAVSWAREGGDGPLRLTWTESGGPPVLAPPERKGFGSTLIEATVRSQLGGHVDRAWTREGLRCAVLIAPDRIGYVAPGADPPVSHAEARPGTDGDRRWPILRDVAVLVVEDEPLIAMEMTARLRALGCRVIGPAATVEDALKAVGSAGADLGAAVLDVNLRGRATFPVADLLARRAVPVVWATGYGELPIGPGVSATAELLRKPLRAGELEAALSRAVTPRSSRAPEAGAAQAL